MLKDILIKDLQTKRPAFGQIKIDPSSIIIKRDLEHTYHSESYVKEAINQSMSTNTPKQLSPQISKEKTLQTRVGVVRKTTVKPLTKKNGPSNSDESEIDTENLPVIHGTFQITKTEADLTESKQNEAQRRPDEKHIHKMSTTLKPITTQKVTTTAKSRPFTIKSTLKVKPRTEPSTKRDAENITITPLPTISTTRAPISTTSVTTTTNISQILLDLLTNENHDKELPKIDSLFTVPHVIDNQPWRPITRPYDYDTTTISKVVDSVSEINAEDRIGVAEVVEDISVLESMLSPIPPTKNRVKNQHKTSPKPIGIYSVDPNLKADVYVPGPMYTSFTLPTYAPPLKNTETLGSSYPKPHPIPVDKISSVVGDNEKIYSQDQDDGKPVDRPPKEKITTVNLNVVPIEEQENSTEKILIDGAAIVKKNENTKTTDKYDTTIIYNSSLTNITNDTMKIETTSTTESYKDSTTVQTTRRTNDKVSVIPSTTIPHHTWELINSSKVNTTNEKDIYNKKIYNDTLQAIITKNDASFPNTTPKFQSKISFLRNLTDLVKQYSQSTTEKLSKEEISETDESDEHVQSVVGIAEVEDEDHITTTPMGVITLLPAKSNLGVNRPLRPRPKINIKQNNSTDNQRSFTSDVDTKTYLPIYNTTLFKKDPSNGFEIINHSEHIPTRNRLPKTNLNDNEVGESTVIRQNISLPEGTYKVSYHVTGSVSSKQANKTKSLPAYELTLEPDVILEIPFNQSNTLTIDKLRQLANLATISDSINNTLFRTPGGVISTKAIPSSYTLNQAGFKILTKTFNKGTSTKENENNYNVYNDKSQVKPVFEYNDEEIMKKKINKKGTV